ncbi:MAG TPA: CaiB/BaiF CoA-transferase family protein, partial [Ramlibacter sp.]|nr:CaiB/BaiF CoA-transferase family protein [Ramlibacter sp.]
GNQVTSYFATGKAPGRYGNAHASLVPYQVFVAADGELVVAVGNDVQWQRYCDAIERPDLARDERWQRVTGRITGRAELIPELARTMLTRSVAEWVARLEAAGVPCGPINDYRQVFEHPQVKHRGLRVDMPQPDGTSVATIASPLRLAATPVRYDRPPPRLGDSTDTVLADVLGCTDSEIAALRASGIVG